MTHVEVLAVSYIKIRSRGVRTISTAVLAIDHFAFRLLGSFSYIHAVNAI
jgi:hypothetical protein